MNLIPEEAGYDNDDDCPLITDQRLRDPWRRVLDYLQIKDLYALSQVCRTFYFDVESYYHGLCNKIPVKENLLSIYESQPALKQDKIDVLKIKHDCYSYKWLFCKWWWKRRLHRKSVATFNMDNLGNTSFITRKFDENIHREVVVFNSVVWLQFINKFRSVLPGEYTAVLRMCNHDAPVKIRLYWEDSTGYHEKVREIKSYTWRNLQNRLRHCRGEPVRLKEDAFVSNYDYRYGWFDFCIAKFHLSDISNVTFEYSDVCDDWWKGGMQCDYVELRPVNCKLD